MLPLPLVPSPTDLSTRMLNALLGREAWAAERLSQHAGKSLRFNIGRFRVSYTIDVNGKLRASDTAVVPDVTLTLPAARLSDLPQILRSRDLDAITQMLHVQGDASLATLVSVLARDLRWDVEEDMARAFGDVIGPRMLRSVRDLFGFADASLRRASANVAEYVGEEARLVATQAAFDGFRDDVSKLLQRVGAIESRAGLAERQAREG